MSLLAILKKKSRVDLFTTPSHSQKFFILSKFRQFYKYDISETDAYNPQEALAQAQAKASKLYGAKATYFLTNGSTSGVIAALLACVKNGEKVLLWSKAHCCHHNAVKLAGAVPVYYDLENDENWGVYGATSPEIIEEKFKANAGIKALIVTSPTYEGIVSDIAKIKEVCKKYGAYLIVDEAHGALYPFCDKLPISAIYQGADFINQSLHKTAGGLNPTAVLHCNIDADGDCDVPKALDLISTTSPSYPLLASIEKNIDYLNSKRGRRKILELLDNIENLKANVNTCDFYCDPKQDLTKIVVKSSTLSGFELSEYLYKNGIEDEKTNDKSTMLLCGVGTDIKKLKKLGNVLKHIN